MNPIWLLTFAIGVVGSNALVLSPIASDVARSFAGSSATDVMTASAVYGAATALSALVLAPRADQIGLHRALVWALAGLVLSLGSSAAASSVSMLILGQALAGLAAGLAAVFAPASRESETLGKVLTGWTLSLVMGVSLSAVLADIVHWRAVYATMAVAALVIALALARTPVGDAPVDSAPSSPLGALRLPGLIPILVSVIAYMIAFYGLYAFLGAHLSVSRGLSTAMTGLAALSYGIGFGAVAPLDRLIDRFGSARAGPVVFAVLMGTYLVLAAAAASAAAVLTVCLLWGAVNHLGLYILVGQLTAIAPRQRGVVLGLYSAVTYVAIFAGTAAFKPLFEAYGFATIAALSAACILPAFLQSSLQRASARRSPANTCR